MSGIAKVDAVVIFVIPRRQYFCQLGGPRRVLELLVGHEKVRSKVVNCKPDRLVIVEYAPMHLKGYHARVPALVVAVVFTP